MSRALFAPVCAITATRRRRFLWVAWWSAPPSRTPFRKPDAFEGGARSPEEARRAAERAAGCSLTEIDSIWARAWANLLVGKEPWPAQRAASNAAQATRTGERASPKASVWDTLGLGSRATLLEIKRAYRRRALQTHPDRGGSAEAFRALQAAYESALARAARPRPKTR